MFIRKLYNRWPAMFYTVILFLAAQLLFMYKAIETVPFFLLTMYSNPTPVQDTIKKTSLYINGKKSDVKSLSDREGEILLGSLGYFLELKKNNFYATDTTTINKRFQGRLPASWYHYIFKNLTNTSVTDTVYLEWWCRYASKVFKEKVDSFSLFQSTIVWQPYYHSLHDSNLVLKYARR